MILLSCDPEVERPAFVLYEVIDKYTRLHKVWRTGNLSAIKRKGWWDEQQLFLRSLSRANDFCIFVCEGQYIAKRDIESDTKTAQDNIRAVMALIRMHGKLQLAAQLAGWSYLPEGVNPMDWMPSITGIPLYRGSKAIQAKSLQIANALARSFGHQERITDHNIAAAVCIGTYAIERITTDPGTGSDTYLGKLLPKPNVSHNTKRRSAAGVVEKENHE